MRYLRLEEDLIYDGSQINPQWAFKAFKIKESNIISWIGPMNIHKDNIVDYEDYDKEIRGDELLHFIIEHFDVQPADIRLCYHRQRLFITIVQDNLYKMGIKTMRKGDDLYVMEDHGKLGKLSVSIATASINSMKIHFALNITSEGTPTDVDITSLNECKDNLQMEMINKLADNISENYMDELKDIESDITKTKVL
jgi:hypothetical protein